MTDRTEDVFVLINNHTGNVYGTRFFVSEAAAIKYIEDGGHYYDALNCPIMPAKLVYRSDRK